MTTTATLINAFEVAPEAESAFLENWARVAEFLEAQHGFIEAALNRCAPGSRFRFTAEMKFTSQDRLWSSIQQPEFRQLLRLSDLPNVPKLCDLFLRPQVRVAA